jgi:hypothetical protein
MTFSSFEILKKKSTVISISSNKDIHIKPMNYFHENYPEIDFLFAWSHKKEKEFFTKK